MNYNINVDMENSICSKERGGESVSKIRDALISALNLLRSERESVCDDELAADYNSTIDKLEVALQSLDALKQ